MGRIQDIASCGPRTPVGVWYGLLSIRMVLIRRCSVAVVEFVDLPLP